MIDQSGWFARCQRNEDEERNACNIYRFVAERLNILSVIIHIYIRIRKLWNHWHCLQTIILYIYTPITNRNENNTLLNGCKSLVCVCVCVLFDFVSVRRLVCTDLYFPVLRCPISLVCILDLNKRLVLPSTQFLPAIVTRWDKQRTREKLKFHEEVKFICISGKIVFVMEILSHFPCLISYALLSAFAFCNSYTIPRHTQRLGGNIRSQMRNNTRMKIKTEEINCKLEEIQRK